MRDEPISIGDAGEVLCTRRTPYGVVVLRPSVDVIERRAIVDRYIIELRNRQVVFVEPRRPAIVAFINSAIATYQVIVGVIRIDPDHVIVNVFVLLTQ